MENGFRKLKQKQHITPFSKPTTQTSCKCRLSECYEDCHMGSNLGGKMFDSDICKKKDGSTLKTYESEYEAQ